MIRPYLIKIGDCDLRLDKGVCLINVLVGTDLMLSHVVIKKHISICYYRRYSTSNWGSGTSYNRFIRVKLRIQAGKYSAS